MSCPVGRRGGHRVGPVRLSVPTEGVDRVGGPVKPDDGYPTARRTGSRVSHAGNGCDRRNRVGCVAGELARHPPAAGEPGGIDLLRVDAVPRFENGYQPGEERDVVCRSGRDALPTDERNSGHVPVESRARRDHRLWIRHDEGILIGGLVHPGQRFLFDGVGAAPVQVEDQRQRVWRAVRGGNVDDDRSPYRSDVELEGRRPGVIRRRTTRRRALRRRGRPCRRGRLRGRAARRRSTAAGDQHRRGHNEEDRDSRPDASRS